VVAVAVEAAVAVAVAVEAAVENRSMPISGRHDQSETWLPSDEMKWKSTPRSARAREPNSLADSA
jgi:hypothetical protein